MTWEGIKAETDLVTAVEAGGTPPEEEDEVDGELI